MKRLSSMALFALAPRIASAHPGHDSAGFAHGFLHPLSGADHILAMVAVGIWAAQLGRSALWAVPLAFVGAMACGGALGMAGVQLPGVEVCIAASVVLLGVLIASAVRDSTWSCALLVGVFAVFHGYAHGAEMAPGSSAVTFSLGFVLSTATLHALGIGLGLAGSRSRAVTRLAGTAIAACGVSLWFAAV